MGGVMTVRAMAWVEDALASAGGLLHGSTLNGEARDREWTGAVIDSRGDCAGRIFFAIPGERVDGHRFVEDAYAAGSVAVVVEDATVVPRLDAARIPYLFVRSSVEALQELSRAYRGRMEARVVAITGSAGKTTTKEYVRAVMRSKYRVHSNPGNYNSLIGVPITVLDAEADCEYLVSEVGANASGEIDFLARLLRPDVGVITNIGDAHVGHFGSRDSIAQAKGELLDHIAPAGAALLPHDDDYAPMLRDRARCRVLTFGAAGADYEVGEVEAQGERLSFTVNRHDISIRAIGAYNAVNACAAYAVGEACGVEPQRIRTALESVVPMPGRGRVHVRGGVFLIDESYNASPASMALSLAMLAGLGEHRRRVAVLGAMKELGDVEAQCHHRVGQQLAGLGIDVVCWIGEQAEAVRAGLEAGGGAVEFHSFDAVEGIVAAFGSLIRAGDAVLVKASRACELDRFVSAFLGTTDERPDT
jgi:UDP-N-acetylmuramoyl-tripeptide--D-alanyl-D-alanine ligase